jgi:hypothetical protein
MVGSSKKHDHLLLLHVADPSANTLLFLEAGASSAHHSHDGGTTERMQCRAADSDLLNPRLVLRQTSRGGIGETIRTSRDPAFLVLADQ